MSRLYTLAPEAIDDIVAIQTYLRSVASAKTARHVVSEIKQAIRFLAGMPGAGHSREDLTDEPLKFWPVFQYLIAYDTRKSPIEIVRILHGKRNIPAILKR